MQPSDSPFPPGYQPEPDSAHARFVGDRIAEVGRYGRQTLAQVVDENAARFGTALAIVEGEHRLTWSDYATRTRSLASALGTLGFSRGDRVGLLMVDGPDIHVAMVACERAGLPVVAIGPRAGLREIRHLLRATSAVALMTLPSHRGTASDDLFREIAEGQTSGLRHLVLDGTRLRVDGAEREPDPTSTSELAPIGLDEIFLINSTSGTTGLPKCVTHHQNRWRYFHVLAMNACPFGRDDVFLPLIPAPFGFGIWTSHVTPVLVGAPTVVMAEFTVDGALELVESLGVTVMACVSTQFVMLLNDPAFGTRDLSSLRALFTGGEAVPYARAAEFEERTGAKVLQFYGSNETGALSYTTVRDDREHRLRTCGRVIDGMHVRLFDEDGADVTATGGPGQATCRGPAASLGYFGDDAANRELIGPDGQMRTGDIVTIDPDGYLSVAGRKSDFIIRGGKNISAVAVEQQVTSHPAVAMAAAVAAPDRVFGERVCAFVVLEDGATLELDELTEFLVGRGVTKETIPEYLVVVDELPRASGEKVAKSVLRADIEHRIGHTRTA